MSDLSYCISTFDVSERFQTPQEFEAFFLKRIRTALEKGAKIVLYPEYSGYTLAQIKSADQTAWTAFQISEFYWNSFAQKVLQLSKQYDALICAGTGPYVDQQNKAIYNRALIACNGVLHAYDKQKLTPWETDYTPGKNLVVIKWKNLKIAPLICFDSEFPEIAVELKKKSVHLILCPSATMDILGSERVQRCASSRAVEIGCAVMTCALVGTDMQNPLVDINEGKCAIYYPSQEIFREENSDFAEKNQTSYIKDGFVELWGTLSTQKLTNAKLATGETKPYLI